MRCARGGSEHGAAGAKERLENHADSIISTLTLSRLLRGKLRRGCARKAALESSAIGCARKLSLVRLAFSAQR